MKEKRFWVAVFADEAKAGTWLCGGEQEAKERWPDAQQYIDATDYDDAEFERLITRR
jgi:hypothetical protein